MQDGTPLIAGGDINPARFVTLSTAANFTVLESNSGDTKLYGISAEHTKNTPQTGSSALHAESGDQPWIFEAGAKCKLKIGSGGCTAGDFLKPDNSGQGVTAAAAATAGAQALETAVEGELAEVRVLHPTLL